MIYSSRLTMDDLGDRFEDWEIECQQGVEPGLMASAGIGQTIDDRLCEWSKLDFFSSSVYSLKYFSFFRFFPVLSSV